MDSTDGDRGDRLPELIRALEDPDPARRAEAAEALGSIGDERAVHPLVKALFDPDAVVSWKAAGALRNTKAGKAVIALIDIHRDSQNSY